ncbi:MAG: hypothetical protein SF070_16085 [Gemmatimonadota bacterium]|nr:hypothetical protein [Gemmatimonadota bacterium]
MEHRRHSVLAEGLDAGLIGGSAVALWFLVRDLLAGHPLRTPSVLGELFLYGNPQPDTAGTVFGAVVVYTALHFVLFVAFAVAVAAVVRLSAQSALARFGLLMLFVIFELFFYVAVNLMSATVGALFPMWTVLAANLFAAVAMGFYFRQRYPEMRGVLREEPLGV